MMVRTNPPRMDTAATRAIFRAIRKNAFLAEVQKFVEKIAVCRKRGEINQAKSVESSSQVKLSQAKPSQAKPSRVEQRQVK